MSLHPCRSAPAVLFLVGLLFVVSGALAMESKRSEESKETEESGARMETDRFTPPLDPSTARALATEALAALDEAEAASKEAERVRHGRRALRRLELLWRDPARRNGALAEALGTAYLAVDDPARALLWYRRAEAYRPGDPAVQRRLALARRRLGHPARGSDPSLLAVLLTWRHTVPVGWRMGALALLGALFWGGLVLRYHRRAWAPWPAVAVAGLLLAALLLSVVIEAIDLRRDRRGLIVAAKTVARRGDGESFAPAFAEPLPGGTHFERIEARGDWWRIRLPSGADGWIPAGDAALIAAREAPPAHP